MIKTTEKPERKTSVAPLYFEELFMSAEDVLDSGYLTEKQASASFEGQPDFVLLPWNRFGFQSPPFVEKNKVFGTGADSFQEVKLKFMHHEESGLGYTSLPVLSLIMRRNMPADATTVIPPETKLAGAKWKLVELKYLSSPGEKKLICLSW